jgi:hypothetical protein
MILLRKNGPGLPEWRTVFSDDALPGVTERNDWEIFSCNSLPVIGSDYQKIDFISPNKHSIISLDSGLLQSDLTCSLPLFLGPSPMVHDYHSGTSGSFNNLVNSQKYQGKDCYVFISSLNVYMLADIVGVILEIFHPTKIYLTPYPASAESCRLGLMPSYKSLKLGLFTLAKEMVIPSVVIELVAIPHCLCPDDERLIKTRFFPSSRLGACCLCLNRDCPGQSLTYLEFIGDIVDVAMTTETRTRDDQQAVYGDIVDFDFFQTEQINCQVGTVLRWSNSLPVTAVISSPDIVELSAISVPSGQCFSFPFMQPGEYKINLSDHGKKVLVKVKK